MKPTFFASSVQHHLLSVLTNFHHYLHLKLFVKLVTYTLYVPMRKIWTARVVIPVSSHFASTDVAASPSTRSSTPGHYGNARIREGLACHSRQRESRTHEYERACKKKYGGMKNIQHLAGTRRVLTRSYIFFIDS